MVSFDHLDLTLSVDMVLACLMVQVRPWLKKSVPVMLHLTAYDPTSVGVFDLSDFAMVKAAVKQFRVAPHVAGSLPDEINHNPAFVEFVFREAPHFAPYVHPSQACNDVFTPTFMEHVMTQIRTMVYSEKIIKYVPLVKRRLYAHHKLNERESFHQLLFEDRRNIVSRLPSELKREVAGFLGLVTSERWLNVLTLVNKQVY
jgi:hypothetical protein